jgi:hypothetical protein
MAGGACTHTAKANCCKTKADCDDNNSCTVDDCPTVGGACSHTAIAGCCKVTGDCPAGSTCVGGYCTAADAGSDAGVIVDAGVDSGKPIADAAPPPPPIDSGVDATSGAVDQGTAAGGGCGCTTPGQRRPIEGAAVAVLAAAAIVGARKRRGRRG